ncbi:hypothetical protein MPTK1_3g21440 [Marchantia polymorpha subsp. ruderalis]|uniref:Uncharacterized protein n=2 Tax=Marchantia polymorpha TaxID=3197 RepID=A0AAF6B385_MARPO|nr:hypothetical protein MARPO_0089s0072 [Marchantia polymorpha]BBN06469.1 hypothetical protein Mp_3g21440 [Marchantia polymorpha subsp. ruderalis]|eukprot:PTQ33450.1 hypothetical protein MARPO_0089s0072 [Marchantia polymorpha]
MDSGTWHDTDSCKCHLLGKNIIVYLTIAMFALGIIVPGYFYISKMYQIKALENRITECVAMHRLHSEAIGNFRV